jgi:uncharacterized membrane protein
MSTTQGIQQAASGSQSLVAPPFPTSSGEFINTLAHFHRAEIARMAGWRDRIDRTTNWAITVVAGMLSVSLSTPTAHHGVLLFAMILVSLLLLIEARRYRFFDVYRARVRQLERNYFAQILAPISPADPEWARKLGQDLRDPQFLITLDTAISRRLRRNYIWMFFVLLLAWVIKISTSSLHLEEPHSTSTQPLLSKVEGLAVGPVPGWAILLVVFVFYCGLVYATLRSHEDTGELAYGKVHV